MKKIITVFLIIIVAVAAGCYGYYVKVEVPKEAYAAAEKAFSAEDYDTAQEKYKDAGSYKDAEEKLAMIQNYKDGLELMEKGSLKKALKKFDQVLEADNPIECSNLRDLCEKYGDFKRTLCAKTEEDRSKTDDKQKFGYYSNVRSSDVVLHLNVQISEDGKVTYLAYADTSKKEKKDAYHEASYEKNSNRIEWTEEDPGDSDYNLAYSYDDNEKYLKISQYDKTSGRMCYSMKTYF